MMSAPTCSIGLRVSWMAVSAWSLEQPMPTSLSGWPSMAPPVQPVTRHCSGSSAWPPANCDDRRHDAGEVLVVEGAEGALAVGQHADLDRGAGARCAAGPPAAGRPARHVGSAAGCSARARRPPSSPVALGRCSNSSCCCSRSPRRPVRPSEGGRAEPPRLRNSCAWTCCLLLLLRAGRLARA